jgi:hypothetical protein
LELLRPTGATLSRLKQRAQCRRRSCAELCSRQVVAGIEKIGGRRFVRRIIFTLALFGLTAALLSNAVASTTKHRLAHPARHHPTPVAAQGPSRIACTVLGCQPIPPACNPVAGRTPGGLPTGYDVIVCPPGVWPLR